MDLSSKGTLPASAATAPPDEQLVLRLRDRDVDALGELYERYKGRIFRTALAITQDRGVAEDILQECFVRLFVHADRIRTDVPLGPWLCRVAVNLSYTWFEKYRRWVEPLEALMDHLTAPLHLLPEPAVEQIEVQERVQRAIEKLPLSQRTVVVLFYLEELSLKEIADILELPEGTVKSRLYYARESLKSLLAEWRPVPGVAHEFT